MNIAARLFSYSQAEQSVSEAPRVLQKAPTNAFWDLAELIYF